MQMDVGLIGENNMTTVVYNHKEGVVACDSRITQGHEISTDNFSKIMKGTDGVTFIVSGNLAQFNTFVNYFPFGMDGEKMPNLDVVSFIVIDGQLFEAYISEGDYSLAPITFNAAIGSGTPFAMSAMDFGCTAKQAVKYAMTRDSATGGKIRTVKVR